MKLKTPLLRHCNTRLIKFKFEDKKFFVDKEKGIVVCRLYGYYKIQIHSFENREEAARFKILLNSLNREYNATIFYEGTATCHKDDVFDEIKGKRIAESKAKSKIYKNMEKTLIKSSQVWSNLFNEAIDTARRYRMLYDNEVMHIKELDSNNE